MEQVNDRLRLDLTDEEVEFGFHLVERGTGVRAIVRELRPGLSAVKVNGQAQAAEYAICNEQLAPLYPAARSIDELRVRFPRPTR
jgi:hypothetical protein